MSRLFALLVLMAVVAVSSAQYYYGGLGYSGVGYAAYPSYSGVGYASYGAYPAYTYGGLGYGYGYLKK